MERREARQTCPDEKFKSYSEAFRNYTSVIYNVKNIYTAQNN